MVCMAPEMCLDFHARQSYWAKLSTMAYVLCYNGGQKERSELSTFYSQISKQ